MKPITAALVTSLALCASAPAISISIEYVNPADTFFSSEAQSTLSKAAADVSFALTTSLTALSQDKYTGVNGGSTVTVDWGLTYKDPTDGTTTLTESIFSFEPNQFVLKVGSRNIGNSTAGVGAPAGASLAFSGEDVGDGTFAGAVDAMEESSNVGMVRGGPILSTASGSVGSENFDLTFGYALGVIAFDNASTSWNFSYANLPGSGQADFYSVAVHEILHALGVGGGQTWRSNVIGTDWQGPAVANLLGSGVDVIDSSGEHIKTGIQGLAIIDGVQTAVGQEVIMSSTLAPGTRRYLTDVDLAFMSDMGWTVIPEPSHATLAALSVLLVTLRHRR